MKVGGGSPPHLAIGNYTSVSTGVEVFLASEHRADLVTTYPFHTFHPAASPTQRAAGLAFGRGDVRVGIDVWLGKDALLLSGVRVGDGAVVGARAVVTRDVPPYAVVAGNPARVVRYRFDEATVARLLAVRWWAWPRPRVDRAVPLLLSGDVDAFLDAAEEEGPSY